MTIYTIMIYEIGTTYIWERQGFFFLMRWWTVAEKFRTERLYIIRYKYSA